MSYRAYWKNDLKEVLPKDQDWQPGDGAVFERNKEVVFIVIINGIVMDYQYDVAALEVSAQKDGIFPIIFCGCGSIGCGGAYVEVTQNESEVVWKRFWHGQCGGEPLPEDDLKAFQVAPDSNIFIKPPLRFARRHYEGVIARLVRELHRYEDNFTLREYQEDLERYKAGDLDRA